MPAFGPDDLRGPAVAWWRVCRREVDRRRIAARHRHALAAHTRAVRSAQRRAGRYAGAAAVALLAVPVASGWAELGWGAASALLAGRAGQSAVEARRRRALPPGPPPLPPPLPVPPPQRSAAWPALRRVDAARAELRRLVAPLPPSARGLVAPALAAAARLDDAARAEAAAVAAAEAAVGDGTATAAPHGGPAAELAERLAALDRAAAAVERLAADVRELARSGGHDGTARLADAVDEVLARSHGVRAAAAVGMPGARGRARP